MSFYEDKIFPRVLDFLNNSLKKDRAKLFSQAQGAVLEVGMGNGASLPFYHASKVSKLVGIEPCKAMLDEAQQRYNALSDAPNSEFIEGSALAMPFADNSFDTVVLCLVMCTIPNPSLAAQEIKRVLKPGGKVLVFEHVVSERSSINRLQGFINPAWKKLACGCELTRNTLNTLNENGFDTSNIESLRHPKMPLLVEQVLLGYATVN